MHSRGIGLGAGGLGFGSEMMHSSERAGGRSQAAAQSSSSSSSRDDNHHKKFDSEDSASTRDPAPAATSGPLSGSLAYAAIRMTEDEAVTSGFLPRFPALLATSSSIGQGDHVHVSMLPSHPHKRPAATGQGLERSGGVDADVAISIPSSAGGPWVASESGLGVANIHKRPPPTACTPSIPSELPSPSGLNSMPACTPLSEENAIAYAKARARIKGEDKDPDRGTGIALGGVTISAHTPRFVQRLVKLPGGAVAAIQNSLGFGRQRLSSWSMGRGRKELKRTGSMARSPTVMRDMGSLSSLSELQYKKQQWEARLDCQTCIVALSAFLLLLWLFKGLPLLSLFLVFFWLPSPDSHPLESNQPQDPPGTSWIECGAIILLLCGVAALLRTAFPHSLRFPLPLNWFFKTPLSPHSWSDFFRPPWRAASYRSAAQKSNPKGNPKMYLGQQKSSFGGSWEYLGSPRTPRGAESLSSGSSGGGSSRVSGCAVHIYSNGDRYEGEFYQGRCSGAGVYIFATSGRYEGEWVDGKYDGFGVETWSRGSRYRGQYRQGLREGYGVYRFYTGDVYAGSWLRGQSHGVGVQTCADGSKFVGEFAWGAKHGFGKYSFRNGDTYCGEYFRDKMHGYGVYQFANGHCYEGAWHEGRKQGLGIYSFRSGEARAGRWHMGALETRSTASSVTSTSPNGVNHSRVLHAVQEARRVAAKAEHVLRVDDRVSKAVSAANRAAVAARVAAAKASQRRSTATSASPLPATEQMQTGS